MTGPRVGAVRPSSARDVLDRCDFLGGETYRLEPLAGGLTNRNYKVTTASGRRFVARFSDPRSALLAIDRDAECSNSRAAASIGIGPGVVEYRPRDGVLVVDWIEGRTLAESDLDDAAQLTRIAAACRTLHSGPRFAGDFDMFAIQRRYLTIVRERGFRLPANYLHFDEHVRRIETVLRGSDAVTVPCHNDLLAANIMDTGTAIRFIDYEYAGNNDPYFELGNIWSEAGLGAEHLAHLVAAYHGTDSPELVARARLFGLMAQYGWTLWASIQDAVSDVEFDFWPWGMQKYTRAVAEFRGPEFDKLLAAIR